MNADEIRTKKFTLTEWPVILVKMTFSKHTM